MVGVVSRLAASGGANILYATAHHRRRPIVHPTMTQRSAMLDPTAAADTAERRSPALAQRAGTIAVGGTAAMVVLTGLANATNYASSLIFSRLLTPASFGDLTALLALVVVVTVPAGAVQTIAAERIAALHAAGEYDRIRYLIRHGLAHVAVLALAAGLVALMAAPLVYTAFGLQAFGAALAVVPLLVASMFVPAVWGLLQGFNRFLALGLLTFISALSRIAFGAPWAAAGGGAGGALAGQAIGIGFGVIVTLWVLRDYLIGRGSGAAKSGMRRRPDARTLSASGAFIAFALLSNLDVLMAKLLLSAQESGEYAALATVGKIVIFLPSAVAVVMVPSLARARLADNSGGEVLRRAALVVGVTTLLAAIPLLAFPDFVMHAMFGNRYLNAASGVRAITVAGAGLALMYLLVVYTVAIQDRRWLLVLGGAVAVQIIAIGLLHRTPTDVATAQAAVIVLALAVNEALFHPLLRAERWVIGERRKGKSPS
jgi:O-antigen/teichoic acid export membrane protein